jgi:hypothetical protein
LKFWIGDSNLEIERYISTRNIELNTKASKKIKLCYNKETDKYNIKISGYLEVNIEPRFDISLITNIDIRYPFITKNIIKLRNTSFIFNSLDSISFQDKIDRILNDIFDIEDLDI